MDDLDQPMRLGYFKEPRPWATNWPPYGERTPAGRPGGYEGEPTALAPLGDPDSDGPDGERLLDAA